MKKLVLLGTLVFAIALALPAYAEVQNIRVSGDVHTFGAYRDNFDLRDATGSGTTADDDEDWVYTSARVRVDADLTDNVSATVRILNERYWGLEEDESNSDGDTRTVIDLANVTLQEFLYSPLTLTIGRQELRYGNALVVGDVDGNASSTQTGIAQEFSKRKAFDSVRAVLDFDPIVVDSFHSIITETGTTSQDLTLTGVDASYALGDYDANVAAYWVWWHQANQTAGTPPQFGGAWTTTPNHGHSIHTIGLRGDISPTPAFNLAGEVAWQAGDYSDTRDQDAMAFQASGSYTFDSSWRPVIRGAYAFFSGEEVANSGDQESWLARFEDQTWGIIADRMQLSTVSAGTPHSASTNMHIFNVGGSIEPIEDVTVAVDYYNYTQDEQVDNTVGAGAGSSAVYSNNDEYGYEVDVVVIYDYTEDVTFDGSLAWFSPGDAWESDSKDSAFQATGGVTVAF